MQAVYTRTRVTGTEDVAVTTHDFYSQAATTFDEAWMTAITDAWKTFLPIDVGFFSSRCTCKELRFYNGYNGDGSPGEVDRVEVIAENLGSGSAMLPPQIACSVTELLGSESRRHWGRFYLPGPDIGAIAADGSYSTAMVNAVATKAETLYDAWTTADYHPIVWVGRAPAGASGHAQVTEIRVDSIPDVVRRRRYEDINLRVTKQIE
jgi:hypothetical protein